MKEVRVGLSGQFFNSKRELKDHIDKNPRITNSKDDDYIRSNLAYCHELLLTKSLKGNICTVATVILFLPLLSLCSKANSFIYSIRACGWDDTSQKQKEG
jgi:hypothetical protein